MVPIASMDGPGVPHCDRITARQPDASASGGPVGSQASEYLLCLRTPRKLVAGHVTRNAGPLCPAQSLFLQGRPSGTAALPDPAREQSGSQLPSLGKRRVDQASFDITPVADPLLARDDHVGCEEQTA